MKKPEPTGFEGADNATLLRALSMAQRTISRLKAEVERMRGLCDKAQVARGMAEQDRAEMASRLAILEDKA